MSRTIELTDMEVLILDLFMRQIFVTYPNYHNEYTDNLRLKIDSALIEISMENQEEIEKFMLNKE